VRVDGFNQLRQFVWRAGGADFNPYRIVDAAAKFHMGAIHLAGPIADPDHVGAHVVPILS